MWEKRCGPPSKRISSRCPAADCRAKARSAADRIDAVGAELQWPPSRRGRDDTSGALPEQLVETTRLGVDNGIAGTLVMAALVKASFEICSACEIDYGIAVGRRSVGEIFRSLCSTSSKARFGCRTRSERCSGSLPSRRWNGKGDSASETTSISTSWPARNIRILKSTTRGYSAPSACGSRELVGANELRVLA